MKKLLVVLFSILLLCGCGKKEIVSNDDFLPLIDEFDEGMSKAHFLSVSDDFYTLSDIEGSDNWTNAYEASYEMMLNENCADFLLSDGMGEYGNMTLCRIGIREEDAYFSILKMKKGHLYEESEQIGESFDKSDSYKVHIEVNGASLKATVNDIEVGEFTVDDFALGAIGVYKGRSGQDAYIDNILVKSVDDKDNSSDETEEDECNELNDGVVCDETVIYYEDFTSTDDNIFAPYYTKVEDGKMCIDYGVMLTKLEGAPAPLFFKSFEADKENIDKAYLYMTALGSYDITINGKYISDNYFDPGVLAYDDELYYVSYDVTDLIGETNDMRILLCHGFYDRVQSFPEYFAPFGDKLAIKGELIIKYKNGDVKIIPTDESFKVSKDGCVRYDDIYQGEIIDDSYIPFAGNETNAGNKVEIDAVAPKYLSMPIYPKEAEPVQKILELSPASVTEPVNGVYVYDFGQNFTGNISIDLSIASLNWEDLGVKDGSCVTFRYAEAINTDNLNNKDGKVGTIYTRNLLTAKATDYYIYHDNASGVLEFRHTYHGFRYVEITGLSKPIPAECIKAGVLSSALDQIGSFECSNEVINRLYENAKFSVYSNFVDNPTDCNQRDERLGWAGDAEIPSEFASYILNTDRFYKKYIHYMNLKQLDGAYPDVAPNTIAAYGNNCWGDAPVIIAWNLYLQYGDLEVITDNYPYFCKWIDYLVENSDNYLRPDTGYGDHLSLQDTPKSLVNTAYSANSALLVSKMAKAQGLDDDADKYEKIYSEFKNAWQKEFIREDASIDVGILKTETETGYALGIAFSLFDDEMIPDAAKRLSILADFSGYTFYPGFAGLDYLLPSLARNGCSESAMKLLETISPNSLLFIVASGLTTMPECFTSLVYEEDGTYSIKGSLNHQAYAGVCAFCYTDILGIKPDEDNPGYKHFYIEPVVAGSLTYAKGSLKTSYGIIEVEWNVNENGKTLRCVVPEDTTCTVILPDGNVNEVQSGEHIFTW